VRVGVGGHLCKCSREDLERVASLLELREELRAQIAQLLRTRGELWEVSCGRWEVGGER
jgi:hypothetical protein